jgi:hypothetical protein
MERWTRPVFRTDLEFKTCYYTNDENLRHADPGWDAYFADYIANDPGIQHCFEHADDAYYSGGGSRGAASLIRASCRPRSPTEASEGRRRPPTPRRG